MSADIQISYREFGSKDYGYEMVNSMLESNIINIAEGANVNAQIARSPLPESVQRVTSDVVRLLVEWNTIFRFTRVDSQNLHAIYS